MVLKTAQKYPISPEFVAKCAAGSTNIFKVHIMQALLENGFTDKIYGELYDQLFSKERADSINHIPEYEDVFSILEAIHEAGGIAILANPQRCKNEKLLEELVAKGLDGIEIYTPELTAEQKEQYAKFAKKNKLLTTGGSNFKGLYNKHVLSVGDCDLPDECVQELNSYKAKKRKAEKKKAAEAK